ncbi:MAG: polymer-forming cytoskeletal protein [Actinobacteria bacterium]|nr:MAG: polymer-forming cytoskeletal protein [Actinomycetota bacterium]
MSRRPAAIVLLLAVAMWPTAASAQVSGSVSPVDQVVLRGDVVVARGQVVGEIVVFSGSATVAGVARGDVVVLDGPITIAGQVGGDVIALHGSVRLLATAQVAGSVRAGGDVRRADGAQVSGGIQRGARFTLAGPLDALGPLLASAAMAVSILIAALVLLLFAPRGVDRVAAAGRTSPFASAGWGLVSVIALPIASIAAGATILGLPLALALLLGIGLLWLIGMAWATWIVGRALLKEPRTRWASLFAGWGVGSAIGLVPFVNVAWWTLGSMFGFGAMVVATWRARSTREPSERRPAVRRQRRERGGRHREGRITVPAEVISLPETPLAED